MESELEEANTEMTEHITTNETQHLESLDICDHFNELLKQFQHELHGILSKEKKNFPILQTLYNKVYLQKICVMLKT